ncbi:MAG: thioredoxin [Armatimonadetes bacterium CG2_30_59_28]|nr:thioredoxin [Armatimonadota bacterium]OIO95026.1 MAG: thioredoxin [Armatimonadetes bacterium CG2_30_59_28]PIU67505.1 MAG: thioredoxin [Armatimonadetes bacterium CG07_land_8_20_14_0_80_59_28]PIX39304.1 MAG: thioredoxin [Armatimonadetes bacterium CG_4_8_14_3_um_filter_58_9]PIY48656.1 MAG: thioredoxin [Armatimonadetes bacterium CG_4_10_14_3_um_filter_59_10]PJB73620.1 MAG: thioredoxin [Armatimonadetes bacterium CG_4_9_14_3_um_filter_58_7]
MSSALEVTAETFEQEVAQAEIPVLVDFWAEWCGPCRMVAPVLDKIAEKYEGKLKVVKVNVDEARDVAAQYGVMSIPNLKFFKGGEVVDELVGTAPEAQIAARADAVIG